MGREHHAKDITVREPLQIWFDKWTAEYANSLAYFRDRASEQIMFVRNEIAALVWTGVPYRESEGASQGQSCKVSAYVIGEHRSKSVRLPIYLFERTDLGLQLVMRGNGRDWRLSVASEQPIESDLFPCLFFTTPPPEPEYTGDELAECYFDGFPPDRIFGYHSENSRRWSACLLSQQALWTVIFLCMRSVGAIQPQVWLTRESHQRMLDEAK